MKNNFSGIPYFGIIGKSLNATVYYRPEMSCTGCFDSYGLEIFECCPKNMLILDYRNSHDNNTIDFIMKNDNPNMFTRFAGDIKKQNEILNIYANNAIKQGIKVLKVSEIK